MPAPADFFLRSKIFSLLSLGHLHAFIHELGHALTYKMLTGKTAPIHLSTASCYAHVDTDDRELAKLSDMSYTWFNLSGPLADVIFSVCLIAGAYALTHYVPMSSGLALGLKIGICVPSLIWIFGEILYAAVSIAKDDYGDFGQIARRGWDHLLVSIAIIAAVLALGTYLIFTYLN